MSGRSSRRASRFVLVAGNPEQDILHPFARIHVQCVRPFPARMRPAADDPDVGVALELVVCAVTVSLGL